MNTEKDLMMYYHTSLRNIGLYTSLSFAALGYSRFYRGNDNYIYNISLILASLAFLSISLYINFYLIIDFERYQKNVNSKDIEKWILVPKILFGFNLIILILGFYTLIREFIDMFNPKEDPMSYL